MKKRTWIDLPHDPFDNRPGMCPAGTAARFIPPPTPDTRLGTMVAETVSAALELTQPSRPHRNTFPPPRRTDRQHPPEDHLRQHLTPTMATAPPFS
jgi:hypothetical protein